ncbi:hypothetical protein [Psychromonas aquimarina]|uniref:hypothetical protein n=1 Tax=Psychromonas aquimarina TaxID=444919 RepID=UPI0004083919|nr:hypothetical protein [Psychromonas aquimarina]
MKKLIIGAALALTTLSSIAGYMPSPTMAQGDRVRVRGESGIEIDTTIAPDMTLQMGGSYGQDKSHDRYYDHLRHNDRDRNEGTIYIQAVIPITFGDKAKPDPSRLYDLELRARNTHIQKLEAELLLLKAAATAGKSNGKEIFVEG